MTQTASSSAQDRRDLGALDWLRMKRSSFESIINLRSCYRFRYGGLLGFGGFQDWMDRKKVIFSLMLQLKTLSVSGRFLKA